MGEHIGYIRVSTTIQNTDRQLADIKLDKVFTDKVSGATLDRPSLKSCLEYLREGDTLHIHSIDRLARNLIDLEKIVKELTSKGIRVQFHKEGWTFEGSDLSASQMFLFQMLGAVAQFERTLIKERQAEGIAKAKEKGIYKGRKPKFTQEQIDEIRARAKEGDIDKSSLALEYGISRQTLYRLLG